MRFKKVLLGIFAGLTVVLLILILPWGGWGPDIPPGTLPVLKDPKSGERFNALATRKMAYVLLDDRARQVQFRPPPSDEVISGVLAAHADASFFEVRQEMVRLVGEHNLCDWHFLVQDDVGDFRSLYFEIPIRGAKLWGHPYIDIFNRNAFAAPPSPAGPGSVRPRDPDYLLMVLGKTDVEFLGQTVTYEELPELLDTLAYQRKVICIVGYHPKVTWAQFIQAYEAVNQIPGGTARVTL